MAYLGANLSGYQAAQSYDPIPPGEYRVQVTDSEVVSTKKDGKPMLKITLSVADGAFANRKIFDNFIIGVPVAMSRLKALATAGNHPHPDMINDSEELHGLTLNVTVKIKEEAGYAPQNKITSFKPAPGAATPRLPSPPPIAAPVAPPTSLPVAPPTSLPVAPPTAPRQPFFTLPPAPAPVASPPPPVVPAPGKMPWD